MSEMKLRSYFAIGWFVLLLFISVGLVLGHELALVAAIIMSVMWVQSRIVKEAFDGWAFLTWEKTNKEPDKKSDD